VCERLVDDRDDMVIKAMSWALRVLIVWNEEEGAVFVARHQDRFASRVVREVRNKLGSGRKNGRRLGAGRKTSPTSRKDLS
jgi:3-methyladenine DNA glycosylase AlkD